MKRKLKTVLAIGGSDSSGGAGLQADIRTIVSLGLHPLSVVTAITAQNSHSIISVEPVSERSLRGQLESIFIDVIPDAIKIGMLGSLENASLIADFISSYSQIPVVTDPVLKASVGGYLFKSINDLKQEAISLQENYINKIFPLSSVITPNIPEAKEILKVKGFDDFLKSTSLKEMAEILMKLCNSEAVVIKGSHSEGDIIVDLLAYENKKDIEFETISHKKINTENLHGTGCVFSSLLASFLALGFPIKDSFLKASEQMKEIIQSSIDYKLGQSSYGPLNINNYSIKD